MIDWAQVNELRVEMGEAFDELDAPIHRLATVDAPAIYSPPVEIEQLPNPQRVLQAALEIFN